MNKTVKLHGIVLKSKRYHEADNILTIFTKEEGKIGAIAKGLRRTKSKFGARLEIFSDIFLVLHRGRNLGIVSQAEINQSFVNLRDDYNKFTHGCAMVDLVDKVTFDNQNDERVFILLKRSLKALNDAKNAYELILVAFDWKLLFVLGFLPNLNYACLECETTDNLVFSIDQGTFICRKCIPFNSTSIEVLSSTIAALKSIIYTKMSKIENLIIEDRVFKELRDLTQKYLIHQIQANLRSRNYL